MKPIVLIPILLPTIVIGGCAEPLGKPAQNTAAVSTLRADDIDAIQVPDQSSEDDLMSFDPNPLHPIELGMDRNRVFQLIGIPDHRSSVLTGPTDSLEGGYFIQEDGAHILYGFDENDRVCFTLVTGKQFEIGPSISIGTSYGALRRALPDHEVVALLGYGTLALVSEEAWAAFSSWDDIRPGDDATVEWFEFRTETCPP